MRNKLKLLTIIAVLSNSCKTTTNNLELRSGTTQVGDIIFLLRLVKEPGQPDLLYRSICKGTPPPPYSESNCTFDLQAREWDKIKQQVKAELEKQLNELSASITKLAALANSSDPNWPIYRDETKEQATLRRQKEHEVSKLASLESLLAEPVVVNLDKSGATLKGEAFESILTKYDNTGILGNTNNYCKFRNHRTAFRKNPSHLSS